MRKHKIMKHDEDGSRDTEERGPVGRAMHRKHKLVKSRRRHRRA